MPAPASRPRVLALWHMRRTALIILGFAALAWGVLALALDSATLKLAGGSSGEAAVSPSCLATTPPGTAALAAAHVDVSPAPGSVTANPHTQISFLGAQASQIRSVSVVGARSGSHVGRLRGYSQGDGASFAADKPF